MIVGKRRLYECHDCRKQTSLKTGTVFENTMLPLTVWFQGMYLLTQAKNSISGLKIAHQLGVRPDTASLAWHKQMARIVERERTANQHLTSALPFLLHLKSAA
ncbi:MAG: hypothetical protein ABL898_15155 [Hyphomicrobiaceae bacterium]